MVPPVNKNQRSRHPSVDHARARARSPTLHALRWSSCCCLILSEEGTVAAVELQLQFSDIQFNSEKEVWVHSLLGVLLMCLLLNLYLYRLIKLINVHIRPACPRENSHIPGVLC